MNIATVLSATLNGVEATPVGAQVTITDRTPSFDIHGLPEMSLREARHRVKSAIRQAGCTIDPNSAVTVELQPTDVRKDGNGFDLPIALALLEAAGVIPADCLSGWTVAGELSLSGEIRPIRGILPMAEMVKRHGLTGIVCAIENVCEAEVIPGVQIRAVSHLADVVQCLQGKAEWPANPLSVRAQPVRRPLCWSDLHGLDNAKRALEIAAAGGHPTLLIGEPGTGKTMLARRLPTIMPEFTPATALEVSKVYSVAGLLPLGTGVLQERPYRAPHHTIAAVSLVGGGNSIVRPGEVSLAHSGVLFLDALPEIPRQVLETLRQPLEKGEVAIVRARQTTRFPAKVLLVAAMSPCPCGWKGSPTHPCKCGPERVQRYLSGISLLDCFQIQVHLEPVPTSVLASGPAGEPSEIVRQRVTAAQRIQSQRYGNESLNGDTPMEALRRANPLAPEVHSLLVQAIETQGLPPQAHDQIWRVARTIADLAGAKDIGQDHLTEALQYQDHSSTR